MTRYYDPKIGRFINADTPKYLEPNTINGLNLYAYCGNNPIKNVDPSGNTPAALLATAFLVGVGMLLIGIWGAVSPEKISGNMIKPYPGQPESDEEDNKVSTTEDRVVNIIKGTLLGGYSGSMATILLGTTLGLSGDLVDGLPMFALGIVSGVLFSTLLIPFLIKIEAPTYDPSKVKQPDLPSFK